MLGSSAPPAEGFRVTLLGHNHLCWMKLVIDLSYIVSQSLLQHTNKINIREKFTAINTKMCILYHTRALDSSQLLVQAEDLS